MGSFTSCEKDPHAWRGWPVWHGDLRPLRFVAVGGSPEVFDASTDDVAGLRADFADRHFTAAVFDGKHRERVFRVWAAEALDQADLVRAQLGVGTWANRTVVPCGWGNLRRGRTHRFKNPWIPEELEVANERNGLGRPWDAPIGALAQARGAEKAAAAAQAAPEGAGAPCSAGADGACQLGDVTAGASGGVDQTSGVGDPCRAGAVARIAVPPCRHDSPMGPAAFASCAGCQAHRLAVLANGGEPPHQLPGVLRCGHSMDGMDLGCPVCAEHVDDIVVAMGGDGFALEVVANIGGPLRPDLSTCVRVDPGAYLRVASNALVRRLAEGGRSALPICEAIQAAQTLDMFFSREGMGFADGDLNHFRRYGRFPKFHSVFVGRDLGTLKSDIV